MKSFLVFLISLWVLNSCVSSNIHEELKEKHQKLKEEKIALELLNSDLNQLKTEYLEQIDGLEYDLEKKQTDLKKKAREYKVVNDQLLELKTSYDLLLQNNSNILKKGNAATREMLADIARIREQLQEKENKLIADQYVLDSVSLEVAKKHRRIKQLEQALSKKDEAMAVLKQSIMEALKNFTGKGLNIYNKDGRIYVSLENSLLFKSGSWVVEQKGADALSKIAQVLSKQKDILILIEGHTDNNPLKVRKGNPIQDNWDLSVKRATQVVKTILKNPKVNPSQITTAGRGEFAPLNDNSTPVLRAKNRRIDVILYPNFSKLENILKGI